MKCPSCSSENIHFCGKRYAHYPMALVAILGLLVAMLHWASMSSNYHCHQCGLNFSHRSVWAWINYILFILLVLVMIANVLIFLLTL